MGDFTRWRSSDARDSTGEEVGAAAAGAAGAAPATIISGSETILGAASTTFAEGFLMRIRKSLREYSNSSRLCSDIVRRICSICSNSGGAAFLVSADFE